MQAIEYELKQPIQYGSELIERVTLKPLTPLMMDEAPADPTTWKLKDVHRLILEITGWERPVLSKISGEDYRGIQEHLSGFLRKFLATGEIDSDS